MPEATNFYRFDQLLGLSLALPNNGVFKERYFELKFTHEILLGADKFLLAYASYRLIERPFRTAVVSSKHFFAATFVIVPLLSLSLFTFPNLSTTTGKTKLLI